MKTPAPPNQRLQPTKARLDLAARTTLITVPRLRG